MGVLRFRDEALDGDGSVASTVERADTSAALKMREDVELSLDYLGRRMRERVEQDLLDRFPATQADAAGQGIHPVTFPLTERYVAEQATAYNRSPRRYFVDENGEETDATREQTTKINRALERARYDEVLHAADQRVILLGSVAVLPQLKRGALRLSTHYPHQVFPVRPDAVAFDRSDPDDYDGFVLDLGDAPGADAQRVYALLQGSARTFYTSAAPTRVGVVLDRDETPVTFRHDDGEVRAGRLLTFLHATLQPDTLMPPQDAVVARMNHELNILYSVIFDTLRLQGHSTPVLNTGTLGKQFAGRVTYGARFPVVLGPKDVDGFQYAAANAPYTEMRDLLQHVAQLFMALLRAAPGDFAADKQAAVSGFAKLVDSLPKLEAREERLRALRWVEEHELSPRVVGVLVQAGDLDPVAHQMRLRTEFREIEFPRTPEEEARALETAIRYNLTTPAKELARRKRIPLDEAEAEVEENREANSSRGSVGTSGPDQQPRGQVASGIGLQTGLAALVAKRQAEKEGMAGAS